MAWCTLLTGPCFLFSQVLALRLQEGRVVCGMSGLRLENRVAFLPLPDFWN